MSFSLTFIILHSEQASKPRNTRLIKVSVAFTSHYDDSSVIDIKQILRHLVTFHTHANNSVYSIQSGHNGAAMHYISPVALLAATWDRPHLRITMK